MVQTQPTALTPDRDIGRGKTDRQAFLQKWLSRVALALMAGVVVLLSICSLRSAAAWIDQPFPGFLVNPRLALAGIALPRWTGTQAEVSWPSRIVAVDGQEVHSRSELEALVRRAGIGRPVTYTLSREGVTREVAIPTMRFTLADFINIFGLYCFISLVYIGIGALVFAMKPHRRVSWVFLITCYLAGLYHLLNFDVIATTTGCLRLYLLVSAFLPAAAVHLSALFPEPKPLIQRQPRWTWAPYGLSLLLAVPLVWWYPHPVIETVYGLVTIYTLICVYALVASSVHAYFHSHSLMARQRAKVVLVGAALAFPLPALANAFTVYDISLLGEQFISYPAVRELPLLIFPVAIAYAIVRHNLFDVDVYIKRAVGYGIMTVIVGLGFAATQVLIHHAVLQPVLGEFSPVVFIGCFSVLVVFCFGPLDRLVQGLVDRLFFRQAFDYKQTVAAVGRSLSAVLDHQEVIGRLLGIVRQKLFVDTAGVFLLDQRTGGCQAVFPAPGAGGAVAELTYTYCPLEMSWISWLAGQKQLVTREDLQEDPRYESARQAVEPAMRELHLSLCLPLIFQDQVKGLLALGQKKSGRPYSREDIELLTTIAHQGAVALENAALAEMIKKEELARINLARYLSPQVVDEVLKNDVQVKLGGARKEVTVLIGDIRNFTAITESLPPDLLVLLLNEYFAAMVEVIFAHQGSIDKYVGDSIVAVFGSLIPLDNSAPAAVRAAVAMMHRVAQLNSSWQIRFGLRLQIGLGISTGEVFLGNIGSPERMEFTVIGDTVNIAARFSALAKGGQILITRETLKLLDGTFRHLVHPPARIKGKDGKLEVFEILYS